MSIKLNYSFNRFAANRLVHASVDLLFLFRILTLPVTFLFPFYLLQTSYVKLVGTSQIITQEVFGKKSDSDIQIIRRSTINVTIIHFK